MKRADHPCIPAWSLSASKMPEGFATGILPWLCVAADIVQVWFLGL
ncbi:MAG: hypothetical protein ACOX4C_08355 [Bacillota bacterium]|jgi:hypothetical protein